MLTFHQNPIIRHDNLSRESRSSERRLEIPCVGKGKQKISISLAGRGVPSLRRSGLAIESGVNIASQQARLQQVQKLSTHALGYLQPNLKPNKDIFSTPLLPSFGPHKGDAVSRLSLLINQYLSNQPHLSSLPSSPPLLNRYGMINTPTYPADIFRTSRIQVRGLLIGAVRARV